MSLLGNLFRRLGYVKLSDHGLTLAEDGRVVFAYPRPRPSAPQAVVDSPVEASYDHQPDAGYQRLAMPAPLQHQVYVSAASAPAQHPHPPHTAAPAPAPTDPLEFSRGGAHKERPEWLARGSSTMPAMARKKHHTQMLWTGAGDARAAEQTLRPGDKTTVLELNDILDPRANAEFSSEAGGPGMTPDVTRVDFRLPEFDFPGSDND